MCQVHALSFLPLLMYLDLQAQALVHNVLYPWSSFRSKIVLFGLFSYIPHVLLQLQSLLSYYGITDWILRR
jgi:hypothetical protein